MLYQKNFYQIRSTQEIFKNIENEKESIGYYDLPFQKTRDIVNFAKDIKQKHIVVIGIGGSSLGTYAIYEFLKDVNHYKKNLHFLESTDPINIRSIIKKIDLNDTIFVVISKSGTTVETISVFKYISSIVNISKENCVVVSDLDSKLTHFAEKNGLKTFKIPKNVGGRFSVFSPVGLVPLAMVGVDINKLLDGAKKVHNSFFEQGAYFDILMEKSRFVVENKNRFNIHVLFSYLSSLEGFNKWYIQLWGESLGKININHTKQAFTPIGLIGPVDQHSFLQLIMEGKRDKTVTFIKIDNFEDTLEIPEGTLKGFEDLEYLDGLKFSDLIDAQANATIEAVANLKDIPYDIVTIEKQDEGSIAKLMFSTQLLTSIVGQYVQINTYDQPGVEDGKIILKNILQEEKT